MCDEHERNKRGNDLEACTDMYRITIWKRRNYILYVRTVGACHQSMSIVLSLCCDEAVAHQHLHPPNVSRDMQPWHTSTYIHQT